MYDVSVLICDVQCADLWHLWRPKLSSCSSCWILYFGPVCGECLEPLSPPTTLH